MSEKPSILDLMRKRPVIGDGSYTFLLEKRGYVKAGCWTPEVVIENPEAVRQLHREFLMAGSDVLQIFTYSASESSLKSRGITYKSEELNQAAYDLLKGIDIAKTYICGGLSPTRSFADAKSKDVVQREFRLQCDIFRKNKVDFILGEFFGHIEEAEWAIEVMKELGIPVACTMRMGPTGDFNDCPPGECAIRLAKAGADMIGLNCQFDPSSCLKTMRMMKEALKQNKLEPFLMLQPVGFHSADMENCKWGYAQLPEFPYCLEPRLLTRFDCRRYAREAYELGVHYFGGCCGFEPYHIREIAEELTPEIGQRPPGQDKNGIFGEALSNSSCTIIHKRTGRDYWMNLIPSFIQSTPLDQGK